MEVRKLGFYLFEAKSRCISNTDATGNLGSLLFDDKLAKHVANTENIQEWDFVRIPSTWSENIDSSAMLISERISFKLHSRLNNRGLV